MKKRTISILTLISIVAMVAGTAMAPAEGRSVRYLGARFVSGKGPVFLFEYTGNISKAELRSAHAIGSNGMALNAHCVDKKDINQIRCTVAGSNRYSEVGLYFMGQGFWASVPRPKAAVVCLGWQAPDGTYIPFDFYSDEVWDNAENDGYPRTNDGLIDYLTDGGEKGDALDRCVTDGSLFTLFN